MAQKVTVHLISDLSGKDADETLRFGLDGKEYEIDLTAAEAGKVRDALTPYIKAARRTTVTKGGSRTRSRSGAATGPDPKAVREWAAANGIKVSDRGRIPADVVAKFEAAGN